MYKYTILSKDYMYTAKSPLPLPRHANPVMAGILPHYLTLYVLDTPLAAAIVPPSPLSEGCEQLSSHSWYYGTTAGVWQTPYQPGRWYYIVASRLYYCTL